MNEWSVRKTPGTQHKKIRSFMGTRFVAWFAVLLLVYLPAAAVTQPSCPGIHVKILNIRNSTGSIDCALFESPIGFPTQFLRYATNLVAMKIRKTETRCDFENIPPGTYAIAAIHDENMNGKLDTNWLGIPKEGYGFSKNAQGQFGGPSFSAASFPYDGRNLDLTITLRY
jgi:uncharacterized protein (DUF2141 family)